MAKPEARAHPKLRILCLHGSRQDGDLFSTRLKTLQKKLSHLAVKSRGTNATWGRGGVALAVCIAKERGRAGGMLAALSKGDAPSCSPGSPITVPW